MAEGYHESASKIIEEILMEYLPGNIVMVKAWWRDGIPTKCDVIRSYIVENPGNLLTAPTKKRYLDVKPHGCSGAHKRMIKEEDIIIS